MLEKQDTLNLHHVPCTKLKQIFEDVCGGDTLDCEISQVDFCAILANCKLLKADFPRTDERWQRFYQKFVVVDATNGRSRAKYQLTPTLIALIMLTQGSPDIKAKAICELFCGQRLLKPAPLGIRASQMNKAKIT